MCILRQLACARGKLQCVLGTRLDLHVGEKLTSPEGQWYFPCVS